MVQENVCIICGAPAKSHLERVCDFCCELDDLVYAERRKATNESALALAREQRATETEGQEREQHRLVARTHAGMALTHRERAAALLGHLAYRERASMDRVQSVVLGNSQPVDTTDVRAMRGRIQAHLDEVRRLDETITKFARGCVPLDVIGVLIRRRQQLAEHLSDRLLEYYRVTECSADRAPQAPAESMAA